VILEEQNFITLEISRVKLQELKVKKYNSKYFWKPLNPAAFLFYEI